MSRVDILACLLLDPPTGAGPFSLIMWSRGQAVVRHCEVEPEQLQDGGGRIPLKKSAEPVGLGWRCAGLGMVRRAVPQPTPQRAGSGVGCGISVASLRRF
jgi:hypothetical protein